MNYLLGGTLVFAAACVLLVRWLALNGVGRVQEPPGFRPMTSQERRSVMVRSAGAPSPEARARAGESGPARGRVLIAVSAGLFAVVYISLRLTIASGPGGASDWVGLAAFAISSALTFALFRGGQVGRQRAQMSSAYDLAQRGALAAEARQHSCPRCRAAGREAGGFCRACAPALSAGAIPVTSALVRAAVVPERATDPELAALRCTHIVRGSIAGDASRVRASLEPRIDALIRRQVDRAEEQILGAWLDPADPTRLWLDAWTRVELSATDHLELRVVVLVVLEGGRVAGVWRMSAWHYEHSTPAAVPGHYAHAA